MTRLFISFYTGLLLTLYGFVVLAHLINTYAIIDVDNVTDARQFSAEIQLLEELDPHISPERRQSLLNMIAEHNQITIELIGKTQIPDYVQTHLTQSNVWFDDEEFNYFKAFTEDNYYRIATDYNHPLIQIEETIENYIIIALMVCVALCCFIWFFVLHRKLALIEKTLISISEGDMAARTSVKQHLQIGQLNTCVNVMADKIEHLLTSHKRLTYSIAHEFRSPLFRMQLHLELLSINKKGVGSNHIKELEDELFSLEDMVDELLSYAQMERAELRPELKRLELHEFTQTLCDKLTFECVHTLHYINNQSLRYFVLADPSLLARALGNLITNADKYAKEHIYVLLTANSETLTIIIEDDGEGIDDNHKQEVFAPYYRIREANNQSGFGLGLAIVKEIVSLHQGAIAIQDSEHGGAKFTMALPHSN
ncbi:ATP-binding protein [Pseudoalteromonas sp. MMG012]|uniref:sensor histidine kinase n=1 Tax=Pseudoalteromonas sp. MMG012 TaxID=2822686 RepID=UPI001B39F832|nr:ATP-binding protein [Pseudoalteromonas sp. MMG012]MBQ4852576.1 hypothetical protein [Pseudoalteromonas sp. MMG012]